LVLLDINQPLIEDIVFGVSKGIMSNTFDDIQTTYLNCKSIDNSDNGDMTIDSTDSQNKNMSKKYTAKSFKLKKQALRTTIIIDDAKQPILYSIEPAKRHDAELGYQLLIHNQSFDKKATTIYGDKGYLMNQDKLQELAIKRIKMVVPAKKYKRSQSDNKNNKSKRKMVKHSKHESERLNRRIYVEHTNSILHRSFKRFSQIYDRKKSSYDGFVQIAICAMLVNVIT